MKDGRLRPKGLTVLSGRALLERWIIRGRMTQAEAAEQIGISRVRLNQILNGESRPSLEVAIRIYDATGTGVRTWLLDDPQVNRVSDHALVADPGDGKPIA